MKTANRETAAEAMKQLVLVGIALLGSISAAQAWTGNELLEYCNTPDSSFPGGACVGFIVGAQDGTMAGFSLALDAAAVVAPKAGDISHTSMWEVVGWCAPAKVTVQQTVDIVKTWLVTHPEERHKLAALLVRKALHDAFPCGK
jgi:Rap1a immunity proteins